MEPWIAPALTVGASFLGGLFGGYISKRGEIHAVHKELDKVVVQTTATTKAAEEIKAKISDEVLTRQRNRDVKRGVIFELAKELSALQFNVTRYSAAKTIVQEWKDGASVSELKKQKNVLTMKLYAITNRYTLSGSARHWQRLFANSLSLSTWKR